MRMPVLSHAIAPPLRGCCVPPRFLPATLPTAFNRPILWQVLVVARIELSVDTFFWMSGFIAAFIMSKRLLPDPRIDTDAPGAALKTFMHSTTQSVVAIVHRFLRLTPLYAFVLFFYIYLLPFTGSGPVWRDAQLSVDMDYCRNHWFLNIFYVSNFAGDPNHRGTESCMQWSWYLAVDFQFFFITAFLMPYYQRFPKLVIAAFVIALAGSIGANMQLSSQSRFAAIALTVAKAGEPKTAPL